MKETVEPLRTGFIGAGVMASWAVYPALHFAPIHLQAVCDLDEGRARALAGKFGTGRCHTDYREMWERESLEAVIVHMHPRRKRGSRPRELPGLLPDGRGVRELRGGR